MIVELISVGTELLMGNITNTNAKFLSEQCANLGMSVYYQVTVGDNKERLSQTLHTAISRSDIVILTGGLGPTEDDLTKETTAEVLNKSLVQDEHTLNRIKEYFKFSTQKQISQNNWKQADIIEGCKVFDNKNGTAPGLLCEAEDGTKVILLPGPPNELQPMVKEQVYPYLASLTSGILYSEMIKVCGIGESLAETMIKDLIDSQTNPTIAPYAKTGQVDFRITAFAKSEEEGRQLVAPVTKELYKRFGTHIFTNKEEENLEDCVIRLLKQKNYTITTAESCTGGLLAARLINVSGASKVFYEGHITYTQEAKEKYLDVSKETLQRYTAVSEAAAREMAYGAAKLANADAAVSITGIAGPEGGTKEIPVGTVYIGCYVAGRVTVEKYQLRGNRLKIREYAVQNALDLLRRCLCL